jgi:hypothetical protein
VSARDDRAGTLLFGTLVGGYLTALVVAGVHGELLAGLVVGVGLVARVAARRRHRQDHG